MSMKNPDTVFEQSSRGPEADELAIDRARPSGLELREIDVPKALRTLDSFLEANRSEQRETFDYLRETLNQTRSDQGERLLFSNE
jgi:hypothetical protein